MGKPIVSLTQNMIRSATLSGVWRMLYNVKKNRGCPFVPSDLRSTSVAHTKIACLNKQHRLFIMHTNMGLWQLCGSISTMDQKMVLTSASEPQVLPALPTHLVQTLSK